MFQKAAESSPLQILPYSGSLMKIFIHFFSFRIEETDDSSKTDPDNDLSRAVTANTLFPPVIEG